MSDLCLYVSNQQKWGLRIGDCGFLLPSVKIDRQTFTLLAVTMMAGAWYFFHPQTAEERKAKISQHDNLPASKEALERKARSEAVLGERSVPMSPSLAVIADSAEAKRSSVS